MRVIVRKERPHPGAQLRLTDPDGHRYTAFATNTRPGGHTANSPTSNCATAAGPAPRTASAPRKTPGCATSRCTSFDPEPDLAAVVALACELTTWTQLLAFTEHPARRVGTQTTAAPDLLPACPGRPARPPCLATPARPRTLGRASARRPDPAARARRPWLNTTPPVPANPGTRPDPWNRRPERSRQNCHTQPAECPHHTGQHRC